MQEELNTYKVRRDLFCFFFHAEIVKGCAIRLFKVPSLFWLKTQPEIFFLSVLPDLAIYSLSYFEMWLYRHLSSNCCSPKMPMKLTCMDCE